MLSNAYFLAKFRFDTAENEPAKKLQNLRPCTRRAPLYRGYEEMEGSLVDLKNARKLARVKGRRENQNEESCSEIKDTQ